MVLLTAGFAAADRQRREMKAALDAERLETARMTGELKAAHDIQLGMVPLPGTIEGLPATLDFHALLEPAEAVGGDLYDAFMLDAHRLCFIIGDVTGKGVPAALFMALSKTLYKSAALRAHMSLHELMMSVNAEIARENPANLFVTLLAGLLDTRTGALELCRADGQERTVAFLNAIHQRETGALSAAAVCQGLYDNVQGFMHGAPAADDITIVVIRFVGPVPPVLTLL
jgi:serine phosphatase RsbU (regulator of sigma subunit)